MSYKGNKGFNFGAIFTLIVIIALIVAVGIGSSGFTDWQFKKWFPEKEIEKTENKEGLVIGGVDNQGIKLSVSAMRVEVSAGVIQSGFAVVPEFVPSYTTATAVTWSLSWKEGATGTCSSSEVSNYVGMIGSNASTRDNRFVYKKDFFDVPIILTVTSVADSSVFSTLQLDCYKEIDFYTNNSSGLDYDTFNPTLNYLNLSQTYLKGTLFSRYAFNYCNLDWTTEFHNAFNNKVVDLGYTDLLDMYLGNFDKTIDLKAMQNENQGKVGLSFALLFGNGMSDEEMTACEHVFVTLINSTFAVGSGNAPFVLTAESENLDNGHKVTCELPWYVKAITINPTSLSLGTESVVL